METTRPAPHLDPAFAAATRPTRSTVRLRTFLPWQLVRFAAINLKMLRIIWKNHHGGSRRMPNAEGRMPKASGPRRKVEG